MKKILSIAVICLLGIACKKETKEPAKTETTYYIKVVEVDADNRSVTETPYIKVKITE